MADFGVIRVHGANFDEFSRSFTKAIQTVPQVERDKLNAIRSNCFHAFGFEGTRARLNGRTVKQTLDEYQPVHCRTVAEGEVTSIVRLGLRLSGMPAPSGTKQCGDKTACDGRLLC